MTQAIGYTSYMQSRHGIRMCNFLRNLCRFCLCLTMRMLSAIGLTVSRTIKVASIFRFRGRNGILKFSYRTSVISIVAFMTSASIGSRSATTVLT